MLNAEVSAVRPGKHNRPVGNLAYIMRFTNVRHRRSLCSALASELTHYRLAAGVPRPPLRIWPDALTAAEEGALVEQADTWFSGRPYEPGHFDGVATAYREMQRPARRFSRTNRAVIERLAQATLGDKSLMPIHLLDLDAAGEIGRHVDHVEYSGAYIVGLSLLSDTVMLLHHEHSESTIEMLLPRRSAYVLTAETRYEWAHSIPARPTFDGRTVEKTRRLSILLRDHAAPTGEGPD